MARGGTGEGGEREERISCRQKMSKGEDDENIKRALWGESGKFYLTQLKSSSLQQFLFLSQQLILKVLVHF